jgi:hypothetical protein
MAVPDKPAPLADIIGRGDGINHAIFMPDELRNSLGWLICQGLVRKQDGQYGLTAEGVRLHNDASAGRRSLFKIWDAIADRFAIMQEGAATPENLSDEEFDAAYRQYRKSTAALLKKRKEKSSQTRRNAK